MCKIAAIFRGVNILFLSNSTHKTIFVDKIFPAVLSPTRFVKT